MIHTCELVYSLGANGKTYGQTPGTCRITGKESTGLPFRDWVRDTFTDHASLKPGSIISNEALFCFDESSEIIQQKTGKEKLQRFRTYSHLVAGGKWYCVTKADKRLIYELVVNDAEMVCLTDSGQKHILFKHKPGMWQLDDIFVMPDIPLFKILHGNMCELMRIGFSQTEIISGNYQGGRIAKAGLENWLRFENEIKAHRGTAFFTFTSWMLFIDDEDKQRIQDMYKK